MELNGIQNSIILSLFPTFSYKLEITNVSLSRGSAFGGTEVTVFGGIFVSGETFCASWRYICSCIVSI